MDGRGHREEDPIAIVGLACRLPGGARSPSSLWDLLVRGGSGHGEVPASRFNSEGFTKSKLSKDGDDYRPRGYFLQEDIREFDPTFFGITEPEALDMDPQQRKLLEIVYECFESAGVRLDQISGSDTGCYVGNFTYDYLIMQSKDPQSFSRFSATGMGPTILSNRISHVFNLKGPSLVIDTACSSSLYCIHMACMALRTADCEGAVVASANLIQSAEHYLAMDKAGFLSPESKCHSFSDHTNGYGRAEGIGALYLKKLSAALRDNDPIRAVIRGSAVGSNGRTGGISAPDPFAQARIIRKAYQSAGLDVSDTSYVECHGTGTSAGDLAELQGLSEVFSSGRETPLDIGTIKPNVGHGEAVSGLSGIIKTTLALEARQLPPTINITKVNPNFSLEEWRLNIVQENREWRPSRTAPSPNLLRASVSSFGYGGANGHLIMENVGSWRESHSDSQLSTTQRRFLLPFSAHSFEALEQRYRDFKLFDVRKYNMNDIAYTLGSRRTDFSCRGYVVIHDNDALELPSTITKSQDEQLGCSSSLAFVYTGQGAQWIGMAKELYEEFSVFRDSIQEMDVVLSHLPHAPAWSLAAALQDTASTSVANQESVAQPLVIAIQIAVTQLLSSWGVRPTAVVGHSSGEISAAFAAGYISAKDAIITAFYRGYVNSFNQAAGAMMAVGLGFEAANEQIEKLRLVESVQIGCINSPENVTLTGDEEAIQSLARELRSRDIFARLLKTGGQAYHSHHMRDLGSKLEELLTSLADYKLPSNTTSQVEFFSTVTGRLKRENFNAQYWRENIESPVLFTDAIEALMKNGGLHVVEIGPHSTLKLPIQQMLETLNLSPREAPYHNALTRGRDGTTCVLDLMGQLFCCSHPIDFHQINPGATKGQAHVICDLPNYPWTYQKSLWKEPYASVRFRSRKFPDHELLGSVAVTGGANTLQWQKRIRLSDTPWLQGHRLEKSIIFPATAYVMMAVEAILQATDSDRGPSCKVRLDSVTIHKALHVSTEEVDLFTTLQWNGPSSETNRSEWTFEIMSAQETSTDLNCSGLVAILDMPEGIKRNFSRSSPLRKWPIRACYRKLAEGGLNFSAQFQSLAEVHVSGRHVPNMPFGLAESLVSTDQQKKGPLHPITLDALLQTGILSALAGTSRSNSMVPVHIDSAIISGNLATYSDPGQILAKSTEASGTTHVDSFLSFNNVVVASLSGVEMTSYIPALALDSEPRRLISKVSWKPSLMLDSLGKADLSSYVNTVLAEYSGIGKYSAMQPSVEAILSLLRFESPNLKVLALGSSHGTRSQPCPFMTKMNVHSNQDVAYVSKDGHFEVLPTGTNMSPLEQQVYDVVLLTENFKTLQIPMTDLLTPNGFLISSTEEAQEIEGFDQWIRAGPMILYKNFKSLQRKHMVWNPTFIIEADDASYTSHTVAFSLSAALGHSAARAPLSRVLDLNFPPGSNFVSLLEIEKPFLRHMTERQLSTIKEITEKASKIVWITTGDVMESAQPDFSLASGLARSVMAEQPTLSFFSLDVRSAELTHARTARNVAAVLNQQDRIDFEFVQHDGILHISRFLDNTNANEELFEIGDQSTDSESTTDSATNHHQLPASTQTFPKKINSKEQRVNEKVCAPDEVEIEALTLSEFMGFSGFVSQAGKDVTHLKKGETVVGMAPIKAQRRVTVPAWACAPVDHDQSVEALATLAYPCAAVLYALKDRGQLQAGERILLHIQEDDLQDIAVQVSKMLGGHILLVVDDAAERDRVIERSVLSHHNILLSDDSFVQNLQALTDNCGVDVYLTTSRNTPQYSIESVCGAFARVIDLSMGHVPEPEETTRVFSGRNVTFSKVELSDLYSSTQTAQHQRWSTLLKEVIGLHRAGLMALRTFSKEGADMNQPGALPPSSTLQPSTTAMARSNSATQKFRNTSSEDSPDEIPAMLTFNPSKTYVIIGGTGGIGTSIADWMLTRGARKIKLVSRTGRSNANSRYLKSKAGLCGASITVARCDISKLEDVNFMIKDIPGDIGGVVHSALGLSEKLFSQTSAKAWHTGIAAKVEGAWNIHNALQVCQRAVDFFLLISSISGSVAQVAQANYCAANHFLDMFARHRRRLGLPAVSMALGMLSDVGYLAHHPEVEEKLARTGISSLTEEQMLRLVELAIMGPPSDINASATQKKKASLDFSESHLLTGLELVGSTEFPASAASSHIIRDPRMGLLRSATPRSDTEDGNSGRMLPVDPKVAPLNGKNLRESIQTGVKDGLAKILGLAAVDMNKTLIDYGVDSMTATEVRRWLLQDYSADVSLFDVLSSAKSITDLVGAVMTAAASN